MTVIAPHRSRMSLLAAALALSVAGGAHAERITINFSGEIEIPGELVENELLGVNEEYRNDNDELIPSSRYSGFVSFSRTEFESAPAEFIGNDGTTTFLGRDMAPSIDFGFTLGDRISLGLDDIPAGTDLDETGAGFVSPFANPGDVWPALLFFRSAEEARNAVEFRPEHLAGIGFSTAINDPVTVQVDNTPLTVQLNVPRPARNPGNDEFELNVTESGAVRGITISDLDRTDENPNDGLRRDAENTVVRLLSFEVDSVSTTTPVDPPAVDPAVILVILELLDD